MVRKSLNDIYALISAWHTHCYNTHDTYLGYFLLWFLFTKHICNFRVSKIQQQIKRLNEYQNTGNTMNRIIRISFVVIAILSTVKAKCKRLTPLSIEPVCGSDGKTYFNKYRLQNAIECLKEKNNVTSVDLHLVHHWGCFIWEKYGIGTTSFILVSQIQTVSISIDTS